MMDADLTLHEITDLQDNALPQVLDIYQQSFPMREQMPFSWWIEFLQAKARGEGKSRHLLALLEGEDDERRVGAFAYYEDEEDGVFLWYLATQPDRRGGGMGARLFREIADRTFQRGHYLFFEVELPEEAGRFSEAEAEFARRRIAWYQRNGAACSAASSTSSRSPGSLPTPWA